MERVKIIAEIGENHIGDMSIAKKLITAATEAGAQYAKFQSYTPSLFKKDDPEYSWFKKVSLSDSQHRELKAFAESSGISFLSSPFSVERARFLCEGLGMQEIKIASGVMLNYPLLDYINSRVDTVFLSTGMATIAEIRDALSHLTNIKNMYVLHCTTQYPCKDNEVHLRAIQALMNEFTNLQIGYSDHTVGCIASIAAVAVGARVIEKHITFDKKAEEGTDHVLSAEPAEFKLMVEQIRRVEQMLGSTEKKPNDSEKEIVDFVRNRFLHQE